MRKNIINTLLIVFALGGSATAQVAIEKDFSGGESVLLEFNDKREAIADGKNKTLILPVVENINQNSEPGTIWFDSTDNIIKLKKDGGETEEMTIPLKTRNNNVTSPASKEINKESGVVLGAESSTAPGVLVLESNTKAMVLPHVDNVKAVINPEPGAMVYDKKEKAIAVFDGENWFFWGDY